MMGAIHWQTVNITFLVVIISLLSQCCDATLGGTCTDASSCTNTQSACNIPSGESQGVCGCESGYYINSAYTSCIAKVGLGSNCPRPDACSTQNAVCSNSNGGVTCVCSSNYYDNNGPGQNGGACIAKGVVGGTCTYGISDSCSDQQAFCSNGNTCLCNGGYYDNNGATIGGVCTTKGVVGGTCTYGISDSCSDQQAFCLHLYGFTCLCNGGYYDNNGATSGGVCTTKGVVGGTCTSGISDSCSDQQAYCSNGNTCLCNGGYYDNNGATSGGVCTTKGAVGGSCTYGISDSCSDPMTTCSTGNTCLCNGGLYDNNGAASGGVCTTKGVVGGTCTYGISDSCSDQQATCSSGNTCVCNSGFYDKNGVCITKVVVGGTCTYGVIDSCSDHQATCSSGNTCVCNGGYYDNNGATSGGVCTTKGTVGGTCTYGISDSCSDPEATCSSGNKCVCNNGFYDNNGAAIRGVCTTKGAVGGTCTYGISDSCSDQQATCSSGYTCVCNSGFYNKNGVCTTKGDVGGTCTYGISDSCSDQHATCLNGNTCLCNGGYYDNNGGTSGGVCTTKGVVGGTCTYGVSDSCSDQQATCSSGNKCISNSIFYDNNGATSGGVCTTKVSLGTSCPRSDACSTLNAECSNSNGGGTCVCSSNFYDDNRIGQIIGTCVSKVNLGSQCPMPDACITNYAVCTGSVCKCSDAYYDDNTDQSSGGSCISKRPLNAYCANRQYNNAQCSDTNALCSNITDKCECKKGYHEENNVCAPNIPLADLCDVNGAADQCSDYHAFCTSDICTCKTTHYDDNGFSASGNCRPISELMVSGITFSGISTTGVTVNWTLPDDKRQHVSSFTLEWSPTDNSVGSGGSRNLSSDTVSDILPNLTPGRAYSVTITSRNTQTQINSERTTSNSKEQAATPIVPGPIIITSSNLDADNKNIYILWNAPTTGVVGGYDVKILDDTETKANLTTSVNNATLTFPTIKNGYNYSIEITSRSQSFDGGRVVPSEKHTEKIQTVVKAPQKPSNVAIYEIGTTSFIVKWSIDGDEPGVTTYTIRLDSYPNIETSKTLTVQGFEQRIYLVEGLEEYWNYSVTVEASTTAGTKTSETSIQVQTLHAAPGKVSDFNVHTSPGGDYTKLEITWKSPSFLNRNSVIDSFAFIHNATDTSVSSKIISSVSANHIYVELIYVDPEEIYTFQVYAVNINGESGEKLIQTLRTPAGVPKNDVEDVEGIKVIQEDDKAELKQTCIDISVIKSFFRQDVYGQIRVTGLIGCAKDTCDFTGMNGQSIEQFHAMDNWNTASKNGLKTYRITSEQWLDDLIGAALSNVIRYTVGNDRCNDNSEEYCNGPLSPSTSYMIRAVACTNDGCLMSKLYGPFTTAVADKIEESTSNNTAAIVGAVMGCIIVILAITTVVGCVYYMRTRKTKSQKGNPGISTELQESKQRSHVSNANEIEVTDGNYMYLDDASRIDTYDAIQITNRDSNTRYSMELHNTTQYSQYEMPELPQDFQPTDKKGQHLYQNVYN